jgi:hypothetical protein
MANIQTTNGITTGVSDDGRISYASCNDGPQIGGRWAWRGHYCGATGKADPSNPVADTDWAAACELMREVDAAHRAYSDALRDAAHAKEDARIDALRGIEQVRGGAYDPNAY